MSRFTLTLVGVSIAVVLGGCSSDLSSLNPFGDSKLDEMKKDNTLKKEALEMNKQCLKLAKSKKEANECNQKAKEHYPTLQTKEYKRWNKSEKNKALSSIDKDLKQAECVLSAKDLESATKCITGDSNATVSKVTKK